MMTNIFLSFFEISISSSPVVLLLLLLTPLLISAMPQNGDIGFGYLSHYA